MIIVTSTIYPLVTHSGSKMFLAAAFESFPAAHIASESFPAAYIVSADIASKLLPAAYIASQ